MNFNSIAASADDLFKRGRIATLERSIGNIAGMDLSLWTGGPFSAEVYPDLPVAMTWPDLLEQTAQRCAACSLLVCWTVPVLP